MVYRSRQKSVKPLKLPKMHRNNVMNPIVFSPLSPILTDRHLSLSLTHTHTHNTTQRFHEPLRSIAARDAPSSHSRRRRPHDCSPKPRRYITRRSIHRLLRAAFSTHRVHKVNDRSVIVEAARNSRSSRTAALSIDEFDAPRCHWQWWCPSRQLVPQ